MKGGRSQGQEQAEAGLERRSCEVHDRDAMSIRGGGITRTVAGRKQECGRKIICRAPRGPARWGWRRARHQLMIFGRPSADSIDFGTFCNQRLGLLTLLGSFSKLSREIQRIREF